MPKLRNSIANSVSAATKNELIPIFPPNVKQTNQLLDEMPKLSNSIANSVSAATKNKVTTPLRRSQRLFHQNPQDLNMGQLKPSKSLKNFAEKPSNEPKKASARSLLPQTPHVGPRRSSRLNPKSEEISNLRCSSRLSKQSSEIRSTKLRHSASIELEDNEGVFFSPKSEEVSNLRRSSRLSKQSSEFRSPTLSPKSDEISNLRRSSRLSKQSIEFRSPTLSPKSDEIANLRCSSRLSKQSSEIRSTKLRHSASIESGNNEGVFFNKVKCKAGVGSCDEILKNRGLVLGLQAVNRRDVFERNQETRKRKRGEEANRESVKGWTKEQEMALQRAYIKVKPTPNFWKQVSKLVPGKSAKDCFDRVHFDYKTPPRSRGKKIDSSPLGCFSLSASKLLGSSSLKVEKLRRNKQKSHIAHKTVRQLLHKHNRLDMNYEADLFSVFEPNEKPSGPDSELNNIVSSSKQLQQKQGFLQQCHESSSETDSPPVLKPVKNRALHEKYIDQLLCREAKRKSACAAGKENNSQANIPKDMVRAAKNALVFYAVDAIKTIQHLQKNPKGNSSDCEDDDLNMDDDESDDGL